MSCAPSKCIFAADRIQNLDKSIANYIKIRSATLDAGISGKLDIRLVEDDIKVIDRRIAETISKMKYLKPCMK
jgi:hypothetical protein